MNETAQMQKNMQSAERMEQIQRNRKREIRKGGHSAFLHSAFCIAERR